MPEQQPKYKCGEIGHTWSHENSTPGGVCKCGKEEWSTPPAPKPIQSYEDRSQEANGLIRKFDIPQFFIADSGERREFPTGAVRDMAAGKGRFDLITPFMLERLAKHYEGGATKYGDRNWEKGIPFSAYIDSALRHINKFRKGMVDEDHLVAAIWNLACVVHFQELGRKDLNDLPNYNETLNVLS